LASSSIKLQTIAPTPEKDKWAAYPSYLHYDYIAPKNPQFKHRDQFAVDRSRYYLGRYSPETLPQQLTATIPGYRADPKGKFGGKDGLETQPLGFDSARLYGTVRRVAETKRLGVPVPDAQTLTALVLKEGKEDMGALAPDINNRDSQDLLETLQETGMGIPDSYLPVLIKEKAAVAKRLNIPFAEAWNGTGHSYADKNTTGKDYARNFEKYYMKAALHPKNRKLYNLIQSALDAER
jgi:hypothetical protein